MNIPDYLFGVGGAGREIVRTFLQQEWIVEEAVREREDVTAYFIDTDTNDDPDDDENPIQETVTEVKTRLDAENASVDITGTHINLIESVSRRPTNDRLLNNTVVGNVAGAEGLEAWWLEDDTDLLRSESNYADGVERRRGLTKALYHYSRADDRDPIGGLYQSVSSGDGAMVVGLGGGSGAGLFIDMAKELSDDLELTLFAVLPDTTARSDDDDAEYANAYASLVELEQLVLSERNPFKNIVLIPKSPATSDSNFDRAITYTIAGFENATESADNIRNYYDEQTSAGVDKFAPFTMAVPQVLTYPGGTRESTRENLESTIESRSTVQETEGNLLDEAETFVDEYYPDYTGGLLEEPGTADSVLESELYGERDGLYQARLQSIRALLDAEFMDHQSFSTVDDLLNDWDDIVDDATDGGEVRSADEREAIIEDLGTESFDAEGAASNVERALIEFVDEELRTIGRRGALQKVKKDLPHSLVSDELSGALDYTTGSVVSDASDIRNQVSSLRRETERARGDAEAVEDEATAEVDARLDEWAAANEETVTAYVELLSRKADIESSLDTLESALSTFARNARRWDDEDEARQARFQFSERDLRQLNRDLEAVGVEKFGDDVILGSVDALREAGEIAVGDDSFFGGILGGNDADEYRDIVDMEISGRVFDVSAYDEPFRPDHTGTACQEKRTALNERASTLRERLVDSMEATLANVSDKHELDRDTVLSQLEELVEEYDDTVDEWTREVEDALDLGEADGAMAALGVDGSKRPTAVPGDKPEEMPGSDAVTTVGKRAAADDEYDDEDATSDLQDELRPALMAALVAPPSAVESSLKAFREELSTHEQKFDDLANIVDHGDKLDDEWDGPVDPGSIPERPDRLDNTDGGHLTTLMPDEGGRLDADDIADAAIWDEETEREILVNALRSAFRGAFDRTGDSGDYLPLFDWSIGGGTQTFERSDYVIPRARQVFLSRAFRGQDDGSDWVDGDQAVIEDVDGEIRNQGQSERWGYMRAAFGDEWDFAGVLFVGGVFLDNIRPVRNEYQSGYRSVSGKEIPINDPDGRFDGAEHIDAVTIRHGHGLGGGTDDVPAGSDGVYYTRDRFIDFDSEADLATLLDHPEENYADAVREALLTEYLGRTGFRSTRPIGADGD